jgi:protein phosphatase
LFDRLKRLIAKRKTKNNKYLNDDIPMSGNNLETSVFGGMYQVASCQSPGKERSHNEDALLTLNFTVLSGDFPVSIGIYIVADGMGGHQNGELASRLAVQGAGGFFIDRIMDLMKSDASTMTDEAFVSIANEAFARAQDLIIRHAPGGGTTLTLVFAVNDRLTAAHVGDSRLYCIRKDEMVLLTKDHSLVKRLVELGEISPSEAEKHPQRNILYRAMGQDDHLVPDVSLFTIDKGDQLMICSDGLWGVMDDLQMQSIIENSSSLNESAALLVAAANEQGGPDNISVVLIKKLA